MGEADRERGVGGGGGLGDKCTCPRGVGLWANYREGLLVFLGVRHGALLRIGSTGGAAGGQSHGLRAAAGDVGFRVLKRWW